MFVSDESIKIFMNVNYNRTVLTINQLEGYKDLNFKLELVDEKSDKTFGYETVILKTLSAESAEMIGKISYHVSIDHHINKYSADMVGFTLPWCLQRQ